MVIHKILNNNLILSRDGQGHEVIVKGCGIAFQKKKGQQVEESRIEKDKRGFANGVALAIMAIYPLFTAPMGNISALGHSDLSFGVEYLPLEPAAPPPSAAYLEKL